MNTWIPHYSEYWILKFGSELNTGDYWIPKFTSEYEYQVNMNTRVCKWIVYYSLKSGAKWLLNEYWIPVFSSKWLLNEYWIPQNPSELTTELNTCRMKWMWILSECEYFPSIQYSFSIHWLHKIRSILKKKMNTSKRMSFFDKTSILKYLLTRNLLNCGVIIWILWAIDTDWIGIIT